MININEDIWEKHAFLVRDFFTFWKAMKVKLRQWLVIVIHGYLGLTKTYLTVSYSTRSVIMALYHSALKLPHNRKLANFEGQKHPLIMVSR